MILNALDVDQQVVYLTNITRTQIAIAEKLPMLRSSEQA